MTNEQPQEAWEKMYEVRFEDGAKLNIKAETFKDLGGSLHFLRSDCLIAIVLVDKMLYCRELPGEDSTS